MGKHNDTLCHLISACVFSDIIVRHLLKKTHVTTEHTFSKYDTTDLIPIACMTTQNDRDVKRHLE